MYGEDNPLRVHFFSGSGTNAPTACEAMRLEMLKDLQDIMTSLLAGPDGQSSMKNYLDNEPVTAPDDASKVRARVEYIKVLIDAKSSLQQAKGVHK
jgi:hypothetical protein